MTHFSTYPKGQTLEFECDYVVIGSGAGGATVAAHLARGGKKVTLIESGPWILPQDYPENLFESLARTYDQAGATATLGSAMWPVIQGKAVGGTTLINSAILVRTPESILQKWRSLLGPQSPITPEKLLAYEEQIERELFALPTPHNIYGKIDQHVHKIAHEKEIQGHSTLRAVKNCAGSALCNVACRMERKQSTDRVYVPELLAAQGILLSNAPVDSIQFEGLRAVSVKGRFIVSHKKFGQFQIRAKNSIVLAASATHTPLILKRSNFKNKNIGNFFRAHPGVTLFGLYNERMDMHQGATQGWATHAFLEHERFKFETLNLPLEILSSRITGAGPTFMNRLEQAPHLAHWVGVLKAEAVGRVTSLWGSKNPAVFYSPTRLDMLRFRHAMQCIADLHFDAGAKAIWPGIHGLPYEITPDTRHLLEQASLDPKCWNSVLSHLFGGAIMGQDARFSVCDAWGKVHDTKNLYIADASAFPTNLGVNPQLSIMGLAAMRAEMLLNQ